MHLIQKLTVFLSILLFSVQAFTASPLTITLSEDSELEVQTYPAGGKELLIILPSEYGIRDGLITLAQNLQNRGVETWIADPYSSWMLPVLESSLAKIPAEAYLKLFKYAQTTGKHIYLLSNDKGAAKLLEAIHQWQLESAPLIAGVILISPNLYINTPTAGNRGELRPIAFTTNVPVFIYLPSKSTLALHINHTVNALENGGSDVFVQVLKNIRARFFFRDDATAAELKASSELSSHIIQAMHLTGTYTQSRKAPPLQDSKWNLSNKTTAKKTGTLRIYNGRLKPENFTVNNLDNQPVSLFDHQGKVVLINFWASWCPPCVHEIPSMNSLKKDLSDQPFTILAINLGEPLADIQSFISTHPVSFPVLLDPQQAVAKKWQVFAFPSSYLLDKKGLIRFSVAGGIDWNSSAVRAAIKTLLAE